MKTRPPSNISETRFVRINPLAWVNPTFEGLRFCWVVLHKEFWLVGYHVPDFEGLVCIPAADYAMMMCFRHIQALSDFLFRSVNRAVRSTVQSIWEKKRSAVGRCGQKRNSSLLLRFWQISERLCRAEHTTSKTYGNVAEDRVSLGQWQPTWQGTDATCPSMHRIYATFNE